MAKKISVSNFKKHCLSLLTDVKNKNLSFTITKRDIPIAKIVPLEEDSAKKSFFGFLKGNIKINDDIVNASFEDDWEINK